MEETHAPLVLEADAERLFKRGADCREQWCVTRRFDTREPVAGIGGEQPGEVLRLGQRGPMRQRPAQVLAQARADFLSERMGMLQTPEEILRVFG